MNIDFKNYIGLSEKIAFYGAICIENFDWAKSINLPNLNVDLPTIEKRAKIEMIMDKKNPIYIQLSDGSKLYFTLDEFRRIHGKPEKGRTMIVQMQRLSHDKSELPSQITNCQVI